MQMMISREVFATNNTDCELSVTFKASGEILHTLNRVCVPERRLHHGRKEPGAKAEERGERNSAR